MKKILVTLLAAAFAISSTAVFAAPKKNNCPFGEVNGVCIQGTLKKSLSSSDQCVVKRCLSKKRCDYKKFCKVVEQPRKKGFWFLTPAIATIPPAAVVVGAATIGIVSGAASTIGGRIGEKLWPRQQAKTLKSGHGPQGHRPSHQWNRPSHHGGWGWGHRPSYHRPGYDAGGAIVGGIIGGAISNWFFRPEPEVVVVTPPPPAVPEIQPWTPAWYTYCGQKYRSFDARTGYYTGYDGQQHFCQ